MSLTGQQMGRARGVRDPWRPIQRGFDWGAPEGVEGSGFLKWTALVHACLLKGRAQLNGKSECRGQGEGQSAEGKGLARARGEAFPSHERGGRCEK